MNKTREYCFAAAAAFVMVFLDQWTKRLAAAGLADGPIVLWNNVFELHYTENQGAAFGIFQGRVSALVIFTSAIMLIAVWAYTRIPSEKHFLPMKIILIGLVSGGIGNLIDRVVNGYVVDFLYFKLIDFPVFNVADIFATTSAIALFIFGVFFYSEEDIDRILHIEKKNNKAE